MSIRVNNTFNNYVTLSKKLLDIINISYLEDDTSLFKFNNVVDKIGRYIVYINEQEETPEPRKVGSKAFQTIRKYILLSIQDEQSNNDLGAYVFIDHNLLFYKNQNSNLNSEIFEYYQNMNNIFFTVDDPKDRDIFDEIVLKYLIKGLQNKEESMITKAFFKYNKGRKNLNNKIVYKEYPSEIIKKI